ncbi:uncharacterized protein LOC131009032 [Salvia miltiorrhiza]|uniref:uncharacterized protein LOC131009032 n=1 Tax=Salvia miltiorrhiza TaxID=226208 RepID=UPI0025ABEBD5|nr:uncharacterized protein LOC131009032 [Salvia miltiorrhiza]
MKFNSGFGCDKNAKKFTAPDEVWDAYCQAHPKDAYLRHGNCPDYEDLEIAIGNGVAVGKNSIGLGSATDDRTLGADENRAPHIEELNYDAENEAFVGLTQDYPPSSGSKSPLVFPKVFVESTQRRAPTKRSRGQFVIRFDRSHFATSRNFNKILRALNTIAPNMMVKPTTAIPAKIRESTRFNHFFKDCIGAIDGTHIPAMVTGRDVSSYRNRHGVQSQNVLAACNFDLQFIYVLSGWEGSAHDSKLLSDTLSRPNGLHVPQGKYFLVDYGFANRRQFLAPLRGVRYHLKDFGGQGRHPTNADELFNLRHAKLRNVIERIFGIFKSRFTIFKMAPPFSFQTQAELVLACAGLHNFFRKECRTDEFPVEDEVENAAPDVENDANNLEYLSQSQLSQRNEANAWRASIANAMWENRSMYGNDGNEDDETEDNV